MVSQLLAGKKKLQVTVLNGVFLIELPDCLGFSEAIALEKTLNNLLLKKPTHIIIDCGRSVFIESSGIGAINNILKTARKQQIKILFWSVHSQTKKILLLAVINQFITIDLQTEAIPLALYYQIEVQPPIIHPSVYSRSKRFIDILGALLGLGITFIVFIPVAVAIKFDSPGPLIFKQTCCGLFGKPFRQWKFRPMVANANKSTRFGRYLQRKKIDKLPQFWNVLKGEMSLVGTRPPTPDEVNTYSVPMWQQLNVKPGIIGEWQLNSRFSNFTLEELISLDLDYQKNWSLKYDFKLIFRAFSIKSSINQTIH